MEIVAWLGTIFLGICMLPQAIQSIINKHSNGLNIPMLLLWGVGCMLMSVYVGFSLHDLPLIVNYVFNTLMFFIIAFYRFFPGRRKCCR